MDIYQEKSNWKIYLAIMGILILTASLIYTTIVANKLKEGERQKVEQWILALENINDVEYEGDLTLQQKITEANTTMPLILIEDSGVIQMGLNYGEEKELDFDFLQKRVDKIKSISM